MAMELEGRRSSDNNWYHCQISICSNGRQNILKVHFSEDGEEDIRTPNEAQSRLRAASKCLEKGGCRRLQVGDTVLVPSSKKGRGTSGFFEAQIRDISRHQHSSVGTCNCKLEVLRVGVMNEKSSNVPASKVHLVDLSTSIHDNPIFRDWIGSITPQVTDRLDTSDAESDMHAQLDEQINKITMLTDTLNETSSSTTAFFADATSRTTRTRRSMRSHSSSLLEHGRKDSSTNSSKSRLGLDKQPRLSPLAARAALAATVLTKPLKQVKPPVSLESKTRLNSTKHRSGMRPVRVAKNASRKRRKNQKAKGKNSRGKQGKSNVISGPDFLDNGCIELSIDIPLNESLFPESSVGLTIDLPIFKG